SMGNQYTLPASLGADSYRLVSSSPYLRIGGASTDITYYNAPVIFDFVATQAGTYLVELFTENECGITRAAMYVTAENCGGGPGGPGGINSYTVYPNPASDEVTIEETENPEKNNSNNSHLGQPILARLYDFQGNFLKVIQLGNRGKTMFDVSKMKEGHYFIVIPIGEEKIGRAHV